MIAVFSHLPNRRQRCRRKSSYPLWAMLVIVFAAWLPSACTRFSPTDRQRDLAAEQVVVKLRQINAGLTSFKCVGKLTLAASDQPLQSFRAAMAGQLSDHLRIDMFAPFGGSAGSVSSDGKNLFLVMHPSREYYKRRFGQGSLRRMVQIDITVGDLLELMVGRIPIKNGFTARLEPDEADSRSHLVLVDSRNRIRQRITFNDTMQPVRSQWFDSSQDVSHTLTLGGQLSVDGFLLSRRIELIGTDGERVSVVLDRYEANVPLDETLFIINRPPS